MASEISEGRGESEKSDKLKSRNRMKILTRPLRSGLGGVTLARAAGLQDNKEEGERGKGEENKVVHSV